MLEVEDITDLETKLIERRRIPKGGSIINIFKSADGIRRFVRAGIVMIIRKPSGISFNIAVMHTSPRDAARLSSRGWLP